MSVVHDCMIPMVFLFITVMMVQLFMKACGGQVGDFKMSVGCTIGRLVLLSLGFVGHGCRDGFVIKCSIVCVGVLVWLW